jgi:hypothetical protein
MEDFIGFLQQLPLQLVLMTCGSGIMFILWMGWLVYRRRQSLKKRRESNHQPQAENISVQKQPPAAKNPPPDPDPLPEPDFDALMMPIMPAPVNLPTDSAQDEPDEPNESEETPQAAPPAEEESSPLQEAVMSTQNPTGSANPMDSANPVDSVEVMRIWRDLADGSLVIQMGGQRYRKMDEIDSPELRRRFQALVRELGRIAFQTAKQGPPQQQAAAPVQPAPPPPSASKPQQKRPHMLEQVVRVSTGQPATPEPAEEEQVGIAHQIEEFLQQKLSQSAAFRHRSIHVRTGHDGGIRIEVDGHFYDAVDEVAEDEARAFIQDAIQEWSARQ